MAEILLSGTASGGSEVAAGHMFDLDDPATGTAVLTVSVVMARAMHGYLAGRSGLALFAPGKLEGYGRLIGTCEVARMLRPVAQAQHRQLRFRWGHQFGPGDLDFIVDGDNGSPQGATCIGFTTYHIQRGCQPKQVGPKDRRPGSCRVGVYYATGTAGECGQPGLWMVRWCYRKSFGAPPLYEDCYFWVLDSVLCPVAGDTLPRVRKWGWG